MAEVETLATPAHTTSKKKHSKKRKAINVTVDDEGEAIDGTVEEGRKAEGGEAIDVTVDEGGEAEGGEAIDVTVDEGGKAIEVTVDASLTGGSAAGAPPLVGYIPTGYDPLAADKRPRARLCRHERYSNRVDVIVGSPHGGTEFVGRSYTGEAAARQLCSYALGFLDKESGTLSVVPIASNRILRLEPYLEVQQPAASEAGSTAEKDEKQMRIQDVTEVFGAKKDKDRDNKLRSLNQQRNDPSAYEDLDFGKSEIATGSNDIEEPVIVRNIPPYDPTANTSEKAYLFDEIIPKNIRPLLLEIVDHFESGEISSKGYGNFVSNRVHKLQELQGEEKERVAWILSYITHLLTLLARNTAMSKRHRKESQATHGPGVPQAVYRKLLLMFTEPGSTTLSTEKKELLINYILVLTLFADDFRSNPSDICADLKITRQMIKPYFDQLGCKAVSAGAFKGSFMTLPAPLKFPEVVRRRRGPRR